MGRYHRPQTTVGSVPYTILSQQSSVMQNPECTHFDLNVRHPLMVDDFQHAMQGYHARHPPPGETEDASVQQEYIFRTQVYSAKICERLFKKYEAKEERSSIKNRWSPKYMVHKAHLTSMIEIR